MANIYIVGSFSRSVLSKTMFKASLDVKCKTLTHVLVWSTNLQKELCHYASATTALHLRHLVKFFVSEDNNNGGEDGKEVVIMKVVISGSFCERWHDATSTQTQLCCKQLHGR